MPDPRDIVRYDDIDIQTATFIIDGTSVTYSATAAGGSAQVGQWVQLTAARTVGLTGNGSEVLGLLLVVHHDGKCTVQTGGYATGPATGTVNAGDRVVGSATAGSVRAAAAATLADVAAQRGFVIDASTPARTVVLL